jgi:hypothetical protein
MAAALESFRLQTDLPYDPAPLLEIAAHPVAQHFRGAAHRNQTLLPKPASHVGERENAIDLLVELERDNRNRTRRQD